MGDENPIRTLGDYSKPSHEGYMITIKLPVGNNVVSLRSDTIRLVQNRCLFHRLKFEDPNQHLKDFLKLMDLLDLDGENRERTRLRLFQFSYVDQASNWLERLPAGSITTWEDLTTRFLAQFFPSGRTAKLRNDILIYGGVSKGGQDKNGAENEAEIKPIKKAEKEEVVEAPSSRPVEYYLKHMINEKLIEGLVDNNKFNDSLSRAQVGKEDKKRPFILGTPFLTMAKAMIKFDKGNITLRFGKSKISFHRIPDSPCMIERGVKNDIEPIAPTMTVNRLVLE
nr:zinc finger, CCHC-type [Tanacetum cinerariifolium]